MVFYGKEYGLYFNVKAMQDISARCGDIDQLGSWLEESDTLAARMEKLAGVICDLMGGWTYKHNCDVEFGLKDGEKLPYVPEAVLLASMTPSDIAALTEEMWQCMGAGSEFAAPEGTEPDPDLAEVASEQKND